MGMRIWRGRVQEERALTRAMPAGEEAGVERREGAQEAFRRLSSIHSCLEAEWQPGPQTEPSQLISEKLSNSGRAQTQPSAFWKISWPQQPGRTWTQPTPYASLLPSCQGDAQSRRSRPLAGSW